MLVVGPKQSGKSSFIQTFTNFKFSYRKTLQRENYKISIARQLFKNEEFEVEFIDTEGYEKNNASWYIPIKKMIAKRFQKTYQHKRTKKYHNFGACQRKEFDFNVFLTRDSHHVIFYE